jgi:hypothetical protein
MVKLKFYDTPPQHSSFDFRVHKRAPGNHSCWLGLNKDDGDENITDQTLIAVTIGGKQFLVPLRVIRAALKAACVGRKKVN